MDEKKLFEKLDKIAKILAIGAMKDKEFREQIKILSEIGFSASEIAETTGKNVNTVNVTKTLMKKKNGR